MERATALPYPLSGASAVVYHGELMVIGGLEAPASDPTGRGDPCVAAARRTWSSAPTMGHSRVGAAAVVVADSIVVAGGRNRDASGSLRLAPETEVFDGKAWHVVTGGDIPTRRDQLAAASDGRTAYFVGGSPGDPGSATEWSSSSTPAPGTGRRGCHRCQEPGPTCRQWWSATPCSASSELPTAEGGTSALANFRFVVGGGRACRRSCRPGRARRWRL